MNTYNICFTTTASLYVEVEADSYDEAVEKAYDAMPSTDFAMNPFDLGDWEDDKDASLVDGEEMP